MQVQILDSVWRKTALICTAVLTFSTFGTAQAYQQTNLVSDFQCSAPTPTQPCLAPTPDSNLLNPWGLIASDMSPWWVSDNNGGVSTLYDGNTGAIVPLVVNIPPLDAKGNGKGTPTGVVFSGGSGFMFHVNDKKAASVFTFVTEDGTIVAWGPDINSNDLPHDAFVVRDNSANPTAATGAVYKGATIAQMTAGGPFFLYVTNFRSGLIEVYDTNFNPVNLNGDRESDHDDQAFIDHKIPDGFAPFNVQEVNGNLYVTYAMQNATKHDDFDFPGFGFVDKFSPKGKLLQRLEQGPWLNAPWGVAVAPANFGFFSNHLLIGNAGSGQIAVYDESGRFDGLLRDANGHGLQNDRLWALRFGNDKGAGPSNWLFFTAGIGGEAHGLFGFFTPADKSAAENNGDDR